MNEDKFSGKAEVYAANRPGYPRELFAFLRDELAFIPGAQIADVGAGTGIFSLALLDAGLRVTAVEPNPDMLATLQKLPANPNFSFTTGNASQTLINPDHSLDGVTAAQAFHWFDPEQFKQECRRILRPNRPVVLVWNHRDPSDPTAGDLYAVNQRHCPNFKGFSGGGGDLTEERFAPFFRDRRVNRREFPHLMPVDGEGFVGRCLSSSYAPKSGDAGFEAYVRDLRELFQKHASNGMIALPLTCLAFWGEV